jgi:site-specific recombinase XerD
MSGMLVARVKAERADIVKRVARRIAYDTPAIADLPEEALERLARQVVAEELRDELKRAARLEKIDLAEERETFLQRVSRTQSTHTQRAYRTALDLLDAWSARKGISPLELTPAIADDWIADLKATGASPATVRLRVAGASAFMSWLERRHEHVRNPFRGTKERPASKAKRPEVPSDEEIALIAGEATPWLRAAIITMAQTGLRVGALPALKVNGANYATTTKGRDIEDTLPSQVKNEIGHAGLPARTPFEAKSAGSIADAFRYLVVKLHEAGRLKARYSVHDLRHAFAVRRYLECCDIYAVKTALHHAGVSVTERYLRSLGLRT